MDNEHGMMGNVRLVEISRIFNKENSKINILTEVIGRNWNKFNSKILLIFNVDSEEIDILNLGKYSYNNIKFIKSIFQIYSDEIAAQIFVYSLDYHINIPEMTNWLIEKDYIKAIRKNFLKIQSESGNIHEYMKLLFKMEIRRNYEEILTYNKFKHLKKLSEIFKIQTNCGRVILEYLINIEKIFNIQNWEDLTFYVNRLIRIQNDKIRRNCSKIFTEYYPIFRKFYDIFRRILMYWNRFSNEILQNSKVKLKKIWKEIFKV